MNHTQNQKIAQVTDETLIIGVDIGGEKHYARAILARGFEVSKKPFPFTSTEEGFESFVSWAYNLADSHKLTKIMIAVEPTGHYWFTFAAFLKKYDVQVVLVAPQHVKHSKEMDDNTQEKDDRKDPISSIELIVHNQMYVVASTVPEWQPWESGRQIEPADQETILWALSGLREAGIQIEKPNPYESLPNDE